MTTTPLHDGAAFVLPTVRANTSPATRRPGLVLRGVATALACAAVAVVGFVPYALFATHGTAERAQQSLGADLPLLAMHTSSSAIHAETSSTGPAALAWPLVVALGTPVARLTVAAAGIASDVVVQGTDEQRLEEGPGHYVGTPLPGQPGNIAIAGHRTTWLRPFYNLQAVRPGDQITLAVGRITWHYVVTHVFVVAPTNLSVIAPLQGWWLTLTTCKPRYSAAQRLVVRARLETQSSPSVPPTATVEGLKTPTVLPRTPVGVLLAWLTGAVMLAAAGIGLARRNRFALMLLLPAAVCCFESYGVLVQLLPANI